MHDEMGCCGYDEIAEKPATTTPLSSRAAAAPRRRPSEGGFMTRRATPGEWLGAGFRGPSVVDFNGSAPTLPPPGGRARKDPVLSGHARGGYMYGSPFLGQVPLVARPASPRISGRHFMGVVLSRSQRDETLAKIAAGTQKLAQVRGWIASRIDQDPMLLRTFREKYISDNFWGYDDLVVKDQWYVDQTQAKLQSQDPAAWDLPEEHLARTDDWARAIDIMHGAMVEYGGATGMRPGAAPATTTRITTPPPPAAPAGISTSDLLIGGAVAVGLGLLVSAIA